MASPAEAAALERARELFVDALEEFAPVITVVTSMAVFKRTRRGWSAYAMCFPVNLADVQPAVAKNVHHVLEILHSFEPPQPPHVSLAIVPPGTSDDPTDTRDFLGVAWHVHDGGDTSEEDESE